MTTLMRYDPFREALSLRDAMNQLLTQSFVRPSEMTGSSAWTAPIDVFETEHGYHLYALVPGMKPEDIELSVQQNTLTLKGQFHPFNMEGKQGRWLVQEIGSGSFERSLTFPKQINPDGIETSYEHGILSITIPVSEAVKPKRISVKSGQPQGQQQKVTVEAGAR